MSIRAFMAAALLLVPSFLLHAETVPLTVGEATILFPAPTGHVAISKLQPRLFAYSSAALSPGNLLIESFYTPADLDRLLGKGGIVGDVYYQVQTLRLLEWQTLGVELWNQVKAEMLAGMLTVDLKELASSDTERNERMSAVAGRSVNVELMTPGSPKLYRETPTSVTYGMVVPIRLGVDDKPVEVKLAVAGATVLVRDKLLYVYAYSADVSPEGIARLHRGFDATIDEMISLNASAAE